MKTVNEELEDALLRHQIYLLRFSGGWKNKIDKRLDVADDKVGGVLGDLKPLPTELQQKRIVGKIQDIRKEEWKKIRGQMQDTAAELGLAESAYMTRTMDTVSPVILDMKKPTRFAIRAASRKINFMGASLKEWVESTGTADIVRMQRMIRLGFARGRTIEQIRQDSIGPAGTTQVTRRNVESVVRTAVSRISAMARKMVIDENKDIVKEEKFVATLDSLTTPICQALDGKISPVGRGPRNPQHFGCRSTVVPVLLPDSIGYRPAKSSTEKAIFRDAKKQGILPDDARFDTFRRTGRFRKFRTAEIRRMTGRVASKTTYQEFLARQTAEFQEDVLGRTKAKLFRAGNLPLSRFVDRRGKTLTLKQLARKDAAAFRAAGLDPDIYK